MAGLTSLDPGTTPSPLKAPQSSDPVAPPTATAAAAAPTIPAPSPNTPSDNIPATNDDHTPVVDPSAPNTDAAKKDRKPRRERLPLPDPIPEQPVKRYPEPSRTKMQADIDAEDATLRACFDRLNSTRAFYDQRQKIRDDGKPAFEEARKLYNQLNEQCRILFESKKSLTNRLKTLKEADMAARASSTTGVELVGIGKDGNEALKGIRTIEELEDRVRDFEYRLGTESMSMSDEKKFVSQISFLTHRGRELIAEKDQSFKDEKVAKDHRVATRKELEESRKEYDAKIDAAKAKLDVQKKAVDSIRAEQELEIKKLQDSTSDVDRDEERKKIGEIKANIRKIRDDFQVELDKWYLNERIHHEQQKIAKRKKWEAQQAEREARRKAWEAEQALYPEPDPYQEEKDMCSGLIVYMQTLLGESVDRPTGGDLRGGKSGTAPSLKASSATREITASGTVIGKLNSNDSAFENLAFSDYVKKSKSKGKKGRRSTSVAANAEVATETDATLKPHSIDYLTAFTKLDIKPPNKISEVRSALEAVKSKKAFYDTAPPPSEEEKAKKVEPKAKKPVSSEKKSTSDVGLVNGDGGAAAFPGLLPEGATPSVTRDASMPSFKAVASGAASAPAAPTPAEIPEMVNGDIPLMDALGNVNMPVDNVGVDESIVAEAEPTMAES